MSTSCDSKGCAEMLIDPDAWAWDFWLADDGSLFHAFYLRAPKALGDPAARHRVARVGHATSTDLSSWTVEGEVLSAGAPGSFDETATWTGSVVRGDDGLWRMFYTGTRFLGPAPEVAHIEAIGVAVSPDLHTWTKRSHPVVEADARWYETHEEAGVAEEAWRDPWVFKDPDGDGWHMLVTARSNRGEADDRGLIGHAWSPDLENWEVRPPLSGPAAGFQHLEVPQVVLVQGRWLLIFSCAAGQLAGRRAGARPDVGSWAVMVDSPTGPFEVSNARPVTSSLLYSSRLVERRAGGWVLMGFLNGEGDGFPGVLSDPIPVQLDSSGHLVLDDPRFRPTNSPTS